MKLIHEEIVWQSKHLYNYCCLFDVFFQEKVAFLLQIPLNEGKRSMSDPVGQGDIILSKKYRLQTLSNYDDWGQFPQAASCD